MHMKGKAAAKSSHAAAVAAAAEAPSEANPYYSATPQKAAVKVPSSPGGRVSNLVLTEESEPAPAPEQKSRLFGGLKKLMRSKSKT